MTKSKRVKKVLLVTAIAAAVSAAAFCILWLVYKRIYFDAVIQNNPGFAAKEGLDCTAYQMCIYSGSDLEVPQYTLDVFFPDNAGRGFTGNYQISQPLVLDEQGKPEEEYNISFTVKPHLFTETVFSFTIVDYSNAESCNDHDAIRSYHFATNTDMEFAYGDSEAYEEMMGMAEDEISGIVTAAKENFCID